MRRFVRACAELALITCLTVGTLASAQASVGEKSVKKFCTKVFAISTRVPDASGGVPAILEAAADFQKQYKKLAKLAPTKPLRTAVKLLSKYYGRLADSGDPYSEAASYTDAEAAAVETITAYAATDCVAAGVVPPT